MLYVSVSYILKLQLSKPQMSRKSCESAAGSLSIITVASSLDVNVISFIC